MYPRISKVRIKGKTYEYLRIVEAYRDSKGKRHQKVIANLGRLDLMDDKLDELVKKLRRYCKGTFVFPGEITNDEAVTWGQVLVTRRLWEELELDRIIGRLCQGKHEFDVAERAFVLVANRLSDPASEHRLARWLDSTYVCDSKGKRFLPDWLPEQEITKERRVRVRWDQLNKWYRSLDAVYEKKKEIEKELYLNVRDLFSLKVDMVFYDITSIYFERRKPSGELRRHGYSRDGKPRDVQVLLGMVMVGGFPIASHIFAGNTADKQTVCEVIRDIDERFGIREVIFVGDRGMMSPDNRDFLDQREGYHYILGHPGRRNANAKMWLERATGEWKDCGKGTRVQEVESGKEGLRVFVVESDARKECERELRERSMARTKEHLESVKRAVDEGRLKDPVKIGARAGCALKEDKGYRYYGYKVSGEGEFEYFEDEAKLQAELIREGRYILITNHSTIKPRDAVKHYKELSDVEDGFRGMKDIVDGRPVYHRTDERVCAHLFIAQLALLLLRQLRKHLEEACVVLSASEALKAMRSLGVSTLDLNGEKQVFVGGLKRDGRRVLSALGIRETAPPGSTRNQTGGSPKAHVVAN